MGAVNVTVGATLTLMLTGLDVLVSPWLSVALAVMLYLPMAGLFQLMEYGAVVAANIRV
jgi:hypothetical protein